MPELNQKQEYSLKFQVSEQSLYNANVGNMVASAIIEHQQEVKDSKVKYKIYLSVDRQCQDENPNIDTKHSISLIKHDCPANCLIETIEIFKNRIELEIAHDSSK